MKESAELRNHFFFFFYRTMVYLPLPFVLKNILMLGVSPGGGGIGGISTAGNDFRAFSERHMGVDNRKNRW